MIKGLNHIAIIVSCIEALDLYFRLGFKEVSSEFKPEKNNTCIFLKDEDGLTLEIFIKDAPNHINDPETRGLRHICFNVDSIDEIEKLLVGYEVKKRLTINSKKIIFIYDYDKQPVEFMELQGVNI